MLDRRSFMGRSLAGVVGAALFARRPLRGAAASPGRYIMTVLGPVPVAETGIVLPHEHVTTDFVGAERFPQPRYDRAVAVATIRPHLEKLRDRGVTTLVECTSNHIGRDVRLLQQLSRETGVHIVTNTGYYGAVGNKFLPAHAREETAEQLAGRWLEEWRRGIDGTGIKPGFIKLGVERGGLPPLHEKLVRAAARVHRDSGLAIGIHTGDGEAALDELRILRDEDVPPGAFIWIHAQNDPGPVQIQVARAGAWISLDGYSLAARNPDRYRNQLLALKEAGCLHRVLLSHDDGWAVEGEDAQSTGLKPFGNGNPEPYTSLFTRLLPDLRTAGFSETELNQLTRHNPVEAFAMGGSRG